MMGQKSFSGTQTAAARAAVAVKNSIKSLPVVSFFTTLLLLLFAGTIFCEFLRFGKISTNLSGTLV